VIIAITSGEKWWATGVVLKLSTVKLTVTATVINFNSRILVFITGTEFFVGYGV
jgi:hypothetical protein